MRVCGFVHNFGTNKYTYNTYSQFVVNCKKFFEETKLNGEIGGEAQPGMSGTV